MKIKLLIAVSFLMVAGIRLSHADDRKFNVPVSENNIEDPGLKSVGVNSVILVTSTNAVLATDVDGNNIATGLIYWVQFSSGSALRLEVRGSTNTANLTSSLTMPYIAVNTSTSVEKESLFYFDPPIPWVNGLSLNLAPAGSTPRTGWDAVAVGVRKQR